MDRPSKAALPETNVVAVVSEHGPMTLREIGKATGLHLYDAMCAVMDAENGGYICKRMTERGYVWEEKSNEPT